MSRICAIIQELESTEFVADFVTTAGAMGTDDEDDDERKSENGKVKGEKRKLSTPSVASLFTQRRNGNCDPQRVQNDIKSFF